MIRPAASLGVLVFSLGIALGQPPAKQAPPPKQAEKKAAPADAKAKPADQKAKPAEAKAAPPKAPEKKPVDREPELRAALAKVEKEKGADSAETATALHELGTYLLDAKKLKEAEPVLFKALEIREKTLGLGTKPTILTIVEISRLLEAKGESFKAKLFSRRVQTYFENLNLPADNPDVKALTARMKTPPGGAAAPVAAVATKPAEEKPGEVRLSARTLDPATAAAFKWRTIGPTSMGGRVVALAVADPDATVFYVASASGGLFKTTNAGVTFTPVFEKEATISIGDVAVAPSNPEIVWVGTGEHNARNSASWGDGVYKSTDGGKTWTNMGLKNSFQIGKIVIHPKNPDIVYVGALGRLWGESEERGVFKTVDGGKHWEKVLYVDAKTGCIDLAMQPDDPETVLAAMYDRLRDNTDDNDPIRRWGPGAGLFKTNDGGRKWTKLTKGLPTVQYGRIGLCYYQKEPKTVYAIIETERSGDNPSAPAAGAATPPGGGAGRPADASKAAPKKEATKEPAKKEPAGKEPAKKTPAPPPAKKAAPPEKGTAPKSTAPAARTTTTPAAQGAGQAPGQRGRPGSGYLGIQGEDAPNGAKLTVIVENGPAEQAGLRVDDVVTSVDGAKVASYTELVTMLQQKRSGDVLALVVVRDKQNKNIQATLGNRGGAGGAGRGAPPGKPFGTSLGGQIPNVQDKQGPDGFQTGGIFKSTDGGETWVRINSLTPRPFYFSKIAVDPQDQNNIYVVGISFHVSKDGGKTFGNGEGIRGIIHDDHHAVWIDPKNPRRIMIGSDGGLFVSHDRLATFDFMGHIPMAQFYHVAVDNRRPYRVFGGLQDNQSWGGPSSTRTRQGPMLHDWINLGGGDGFVCQVDPADPDLVYFESQNGAMQRVNLRTGEGGGIRPAQAGGRTYRWNWKTPFILSSHNSKIFYAAANYVFRSIDRGNRLQSISPEITHTNKGTATAVAESPLDPNVLYAGTDDGALWVTKDGGQNWTDLKDSLKSLVPPGFWVDTIECSRFAAGRVYVAFDCHRANNDEPFPAVSEDYGKTWKLIRGNLPSGSTRCLREDRTSGDVLYCGTEFGLWVSVDRGKDWTKLSGLPTVAVHDVAQPTTADDLVAATHGRGFWIMEVAPLRQLAKSSAREADAHLFKPSNSYLWNLQLGGSRYGHRGFVGENATTDAAIYFSLRKKATKATLKILDADGKSIAEPRIPVDAGFHRILWNRRRVDLNAIAGGFAGGGGGGPGGRGGARFVEPGTYRVVLTVDGKEQSQILKIDADPEMPVTASALDERYEHVEKIEKGEDEDEEKEMEEKREKQREDKSN